GSGATVLAVSTCATGSSAGSAPIAAGASMAPLNNAPAQKYQRPVGRTMLRLLPTTTDFASAMRGKDKCWCATRCAPQCPNQGASLRNGGTWSIYRAHSDTTFSGHAEPAQGSE